MLDDECDDDKLSLIEEDSFAVIGGADYKRSGVKTETTSKSLNYQALKLMNVTI